MTTISGQLPGMRSRHKIYIATPCYGGQLSSLYLSSLLSLTDALKAENITVHLKLYGNESLINRARNSMVADFLGHTDCDYLLFIDADISFSIETILAMINYDKAIVAAAVPLKGLDWKAAFAQRNKCQTAAELEKAAIIYNINYGAEDGLIFNVDAQGFAKVEMIGAAMMLIKREVFDIMRTRLPDHQYVNDIVSYDNTYTRDNFWLFFETMRHPQSNRYLSEDFAFCYRWRHYCNGEIYAYMKADVTHHGTYQFKSMPK